MNARAQGLRVSGPPTGTLGPCYGRRIEPLFDSHCHLDFEALTADRDEVVAEALAAGVERVLIPGVSPAQWPRARAVAAHRLTVQHAIGLHPLALGDGVSAGALHDAALDAGACAIGEFGWHGRDPAEREAQDAAADVHFAVAATLGLPVILHVVGAHAHAIERLRAERDQRGAALFGVVHGFSGSVPQIADYLALGLHLSIGPSVLRDGARRPLEAARAIPRDRLMVETDAPDQHPPGRLRGAPADLRAVVQAVADARGEPFAALAKCTFANAAGVFPIP